MTKIIMKQFKLALIFIGMVATALSLYAFAIEALAFVRDPGNQELVIQAILAEETPKIERTYAYNERVNQDLIKQEIHALSVRFNLNEALFNRIVNCESGYNNLAENKTSTARGLCQYIAGTWEATESFQVYRRSAFDYKHNLWECALDIGNNELHKWAESKGCWSSLP